ncbi:MAG: Holliday junction branch migration protein RuvA [Capsulimonadaceae bacterium]|nr:Holliday junction branch migration protein RuvA [Capsulimonadaceae bacterium]
MIARLSGTLAHAEANIVIVDVGGVGYKVTVPVSTLTQLGAVGAAVVLHIHTAVREDDIALYGFSTIDQQKAFELLLSVTGIGPKVALSILSGMEVSALADAVAAGDVRTLTRVPGLGPKNAQRLVLELREKMQLIAFDRRADQQSPSKARLPQDVILADVIDGLINLGYNRNDARKAAERAMNDTADKSNTATLLRASLGLLTKG